MVPLDARFLGAPIAHRGYHDRAQGRIENSPSAIRAALEAGYGIEIDLQPSADGAAMVFHDYQMDRLTGEAGLISDRTAAALGTTTLSGSQDFIQALPATLHQVAGRVPLLIEIKDTDGTLGRNVGPLPEAVAMALKDYFGPVAVMSFNPHIVAAFGELLPRVARGIVTQDYRRKAWSRIPAEAIGPLADLDAFEEVGASFISCDREDLDRPVVHALKARGIPILTWTVKSQAQEMEARKIADNITFEGYAARIP